MKSEKCITTIKDRSHALINSGQLKAKYRASESTFSFYFNDIDQKFRQNTAEIRSIILE